MKTLIYTIKIMKKYGFLYIGAIITMSISRSFLDVIFSGIINTLFQSIESRNLDTFNEVLISGIFKGFIIIGIWMACGMIYNVEAKRATANLQTLIYTKALRLPIVYYEKHNSGEFLARLSYNIDKASQIYGSRLRRLLYPILSVSVYIITMININLKLAMALLITNTVLLLLNIILSKPMQKVSNHLIAVKSNESQIIMSIVHGIATIKMYFMETLMAKKYREILDNWKKAQFMRNIIAATLESLNSGFDLLCSVFFLAVGVQFVSQNEVTLGELSAIYIMYSAFSFHFLQIGRYIPELSECIVYMKDLFDFINLEEEYVPASPLKEISINNEPIISFESITFGYDNETPVLKNYSLDLEKGKITAITGCSGCGKSTLMKLLMGFYPITSGKIKIYGQDIMDLGYENVRNIIAYVPQDSYLYNTTIAENISYGNPNASMEEIIEAAKMANAHEFIMKQSEGYSTKISERGISLSGGERQRISIARAILKNSPIIILDEATAALDNESEILIQESLHKLMENRTVVMVAHKPTTIAYADTKVQLS